jgi:hypothetical protein
LFEQSLSVTVPRHLLPCVSLSRASGAARIGGPIPTRLRRRATALVMTVGLPELALDASYEVVHLPDVADPVALSHIAAKNPDLVVLGAGTRSLRELLSQHPTLDSMPQAVLGDAPHSRAALPDAVEDALWKHCTRFSTHQSLGFTITT